MQLKESFTEIRKIIPAKNELIVIGKLSDKSLWHKERFSEELYAHAVDQNGRITREIFLGRAYQNKCHSTSRGNIAVGYYDQDIIEDSRIKSGFCLWDIYGNSVWEDNSNIIADCHAVHVGEKSIWYAVNDAYIVRLDEKTKPTEFFLAPMHGIVDLCCNKDETQFLFVTKQMKNGCLKKIVFHTCQLDDGVFGDAAYCENCITSKSNKGYAFHRGYGIVWND